MKIVKIVLGIISLGMAAGIGVYIANKANESELAKLKGSQGKFKQYYDVTRLWLKLQNSGKEISSYFANNNITHFAIYGAGTMGDLLYDCMKDNEHKIAFFIEETGVEIKNFLGNIDLKTLENPISFEGLDIIVITSVSYFKSIKQNLLSLGCTCPIVSLEDIIYSLE